MVNIEEFRKAQRADGPATIMAIGTASPAICFPQSTYPDWYFRVTKNEHKKELKEKFTRICERSMITKRYLHLTEEILKDKPNFYNDKAPSLDERHKIVLVEVPKLGADAATRALKEWGQPKSKITHLVFSSSCGVDMPGGDYELVVLLGLNPSVKRVLMYQHGCYGGGSVLRVAKDLAENNKGARVLVVCSEITAIGFHGPKENRIDGLVGQALFGDGAAAVIVGSDPLPNVEKPLFKLVSAFQTIIPDSKPLITASISEAGLKYRLDRKIPDTVSSHVENTLEEAFQPLGISDWNSLFWVAHPGGRAILDQMEEKLNLMPDKLKASRHVLSEYGNMLTVCVFFVLNEMRHSSSINGCQTT